MTNPLPFPDTITRLKQIKADFISRQIVLVRMRDQVDDMVKESYEIEAFIQMTINQLEQQKTEHETEKGVIN